MCWVCVCACVRMCVCVCVCVCACVCSVCLQEWEHGRGWGPVLIPGVDGWICYCVNVCLFVCMCEWVIDCVGVGCVCVYRVHATYMQSSSGTVLWELGPSKHIYDLSDQFYF